MAVAPPIDIGIPAEQRAQIAEGLGRVLADSTVLYAKTHGFHWNVTGPMFNTLHLMFMEQYTELWTALDEIARLGYDPVYGARPLKRVIQQQLQNLLARELLAGSFPEGSAVRVDFVQDGFTFTTA